jgi:hypothetical protein
MALQETIIKFDHIKHRVKMAISSDESLSQLKITLNNLLDLLDEDIRVSYLAYYSPYISLIDDNDNGTVKHSWEVITTDDEVRNMFSHAEFDEGPTRLFVRTNCGCH